MVNRKRQGRQVSSCLSFPKADLGGHGSSSLEAPGFAGPNAKPKGRALCSPVIQDLKMAVWWPQHDRRHTLRPALFSFGQGTIRSWSC